MNSSRLPLLLLLLVLCSSSPVWAFGLRDAGGNSTGNLHDFSKTNGNLVSAVSDTRVCVFCHTPHSASAESVLWNRGFPATFGSFPMYAGNPGGVAIRDDTGSGSINERSGYGLAGEYPNGASRMCLSCHDGATALNNVITGGFIAMTYFSIDDYINNGSGNAGLNVDLSVSHPVSFKYDGTLPGDIDAWHQAKNGGAGDGLRYQATTDPEVPLDRQGRMQCTTCHDPHDDTRGTIGLPFWRKETATYNDVCNTCHSSGAPDLGLGGTDHNINR